MHKKLAGSELSIPIHYFRFGNSSKDAAMVITEEQIKKQVDIGEIIDVVDEVFHEDDIYMIPKTYLSVPKGDFRAMPARVGSVSGIKWVSVHPENPKIGKPTVQATIILNDANTGDNLCVMDGSYVTKLRTAAAAAVATRKLANKDSKIAAFIGCGAQTELHVRAITYVMPSIERLNFCDTSSDALERISDEFESELFNVTTSPNVSTTLNNADIVTTLTPSTEPVVKGDWLKTGMHINAMGADAKGKREFDAKAYSRVDIWAYDDHDQAYHSGETQHITLDEARLSFPLRDIVGRTLESQITLFDSTGLAIQDIAVAKHILQKHVDWPRKL